MGRRNLKSSMKKASLKKAFKAAEADIEKPKKTRTRARQSNSKLGLIGGLAGSYFGPYGADLGRAAGNAISKITGMGDYTINKNTVIQGNTVPTFMQGGSGVRVCHREFLADVVGSQAFSLTAYSINPGLANVFPLLAQIAQTFDEYDFHGLVFEYRTTSGNAVSSSSAALGAVIMATTYDSADPLFTNKQAMESYQFSNSIVPSQGCIHPVECASERNVLRSLYTRTGPVPPGTDVRMYDQGIFQIATVGQQSNYTIGELWVSYDVYLRKPRLINAPTLTAPFVWHTTTGPLNTGSATAPFGASPQTLGADPRVSLLNLTNPSQVQLSAVGTYYVTFLVTTGGTISLSPQVSFGTNISLYSLLQARTATNVIITNPATTYSIAEAVIRVNVPGTGASNIVSIAFAASGVLACDVIVSRLSGLQSVLPPPGTQPSHAVRRFSDAFIDLSIDDEKSPEVRFGR